jgi:hypothetical protein
MSGAAVTTTPGLASLKIDDSITSWADAVE